MGEFIRDRLPDAVSFFDAEGVPLSGKGEWRTGRCDFHGGSDSLRVNVERGSWVCMSCGEKGGDVLAYVMKAHGLGFVEAAKRLGAWQDDGKAYSGPSRPSTLPSRDALHLASREMRIGFVVMSDMLRGVFPSDGDWQRFIEAARRVDMLSRDGA